MATIETKIARLDGSHFNARFKAPTSGLSYLEGNTYSGAYRFGQLSINCMPIPAEDGKKIILAPRPRLSLPSGGFPTTPWVTGETASGWNQRFARYWQRGGDSLYYYNTSASSGTIKRGSTFTSASLVSGLDVNNDTSPFPGGKISVGGTEFYDGTNNYFVISNGRVRPYYINTSFVATQIADVDCPSGSGTSPYIAYMDGALFVAKDNAIYNSEFGSITNWPGYSRTKEQYPEPILALEKHRNAIVAFSNNSTEFFFNAGYSGTSPLNRQETYASRIGLVRTFGTSGHPFVTIEDTTFFLGKGFGGQLGLYRLANFKIDKVSPPWIDMLLYNYTNDSASNGQLMHVTGFRFGGFTYVLLNLIPGINENISSTSVSAMSWVYVPELEYWGLWSARTNSTEGTPSFKMSETGSVGYIQQFPVNHISNGGQGYLFGTHNYTGELISFVPRGFYELVVNADWVYGTTYPIDFLIRTPVLDFGSAKNKHYKKMFYINWNSLSDETSTNVTAYPFPQLYKEEGSGYPTGLVSPTVGDSFVSNLGTAKKLIVEATWTGGGWNSLDGLEFHYIEQEQ